MSSMRVASKVLRSMYVYTARRRRLTSQVVSRPSSLPAPTWLPRLWLSQRWKAVRVRISSACSHWRGRRQPTGATGTRRTRCAAALTWGSDQQPSENGSRSDISSCASEL